MRVIRAGKKKPPFESISRFEPSPMFRLDPEYVVPCRLFEKWKGKLKASGYASVDDLPEGSELLAEYHEIEAEFEALE